MAIQEIPRAFKYTCDGCGDVWLQENATGHYTNSRPPGWATLKFDRDGVQNLPSVHIEKLFCVKCADEWIAEGSVSG